MFISFFLYMFLFLKSQNHQCSDGKYGLIDRNAGPYAGHAENIRKNTVQNNEQQRVALDEQIGQFILLSRIKISNGDAQESDKNQPRKKYRKHKRNVPGNIRWSAEHNRNQMPA